MKIRNQVVLVDCGSEARNSDICANHFSILSVNRLREADET